MTRRIIVAAWLGCVVLSATQAFAQTTKESSPKEQRDAFFKGEKIPQLEIDIGPKELDSLRRDPRKYVKATLKEDGKVVGKDVGVHLRGAAGSFRGVDDKPGLTINMDKFVDGQLYRGMDKFHLANSAQDPSYLSELLCGELFRAAGVPAARVSHAVVTVSGRRRGFYYLKEGYDKAFLKEHFKSSDGNFYDGGFLRDIDQPLQLISTKGDVANHADLKALLAATQIGDHAKRFQKLEELLDLDQFLAYVAIEVIAWDWDGYPMNRNNFRIYHDPKKNKLLFVPSGLDQMFGDPNGTIFPGFQGIVARTLIETPQGREKYLVKLAEIMKTVYRSDDLVKRLNELQARVQPVLKSVDAGAGNDYPNQVNRLKNAIPQRAKTVAEQLAKTKK